MSINKDQIQIEDFEFTPQVQAGGVLAVSFNIFASDRAVKGDDYYGRVTNPDYCLAGVKGGVRLRNRIVVGGQELDSHKHCWPMNNRDMREQFDVIMPSEPGTYQGSVQLFSQDSGQLAAERSFTVEVGTTTGGGGTTQCPTGYFRDENGNCVASDDGDHGFGEDGSQGGINESLRYGAYIVGGLAVIRALGFVQGE